SGRRRRQRTRGAADQLLAVTPRREARGPLRRRKRGRHVPPVAVLPAPSFVDQAVRTVRAGHPRVRTLRLEQPAPRREGVPRPHVLDDGWHLVLPLAPGDGAESRRLRATDEARGALRMPMDRNATGRG